MSQQPGGGPEPSPARELREAADPAKQPALGSQAGDVEMAAADDAEETEPGQGSSGGAAAEPQLQASGPGLGGAVEPEAAEDPWDGMLPADQQEALERRIEALNQKSLQLTVSALEESQAAAAAAPKCGGAGTTTARTGSKQPRQPDAMEANAMACLAYENAAFRREINRIRKEHRKEIASYEAKLHPGRLPQALEGAAFKEEALRLRAANQDLRQRMRQMVEINDQKWGMMQANLEEMQELCAHAEALERALAEAQRQQKASAASVTKLQADLKRLQTSLEVEKAARKSAEASAKREQALREVVEAKLNKQQRAAAAIKEATSAVSNSPSTANAVRDQWFKETVQPYLQRERTSREAAESSLKDAVKALETSQTAVKALETKLARYESPANSAVDPQAPKAAKPPAAIAAPAEPAAKDAAGPTGPGNESPAVSASGTSQATPPGKRKQAVQPAGAKRARSTKAEPGAADSSAAAAIVPAAKSLAVVAGSPLSDLGPRLKALEERLGAPPPGTEQPEALQQGLWSAVQGLLIRMQDLEAAAKKQAAAKPKAVPAALKLKKKPSPEGQKSPAGSGDAQQHSSGSPAGGGTASQLGQRPPAHANAGARLQPGPQQTLRATQPPPPPKRPKQQQQQQQQKQMMMMPDQQPASSAVPPHLGQQQQQQQQPAAMGGQPPQYIVPMQPQHADGMRSMQGGLPPGFSSMAMAAPAQQPMQWGGGGGPPVQMDELQLQHGSHPPHMMQQPQDQQMQQPYGYEGGYGYY